jgi:hypothetical protein
MTYVLDRDGLGACPDDPMRTGDAVERQNQALIADRYYLELIETVTAMAQGKQDSVKLLGIERSVDDILYEIIENQPAADVLRLFFPGPAKSYAGEKMIDAWCYMKAQALAEQEA